MNELIKLANSKVANFDMTDWTLMKTAIMLVGVLIGCTFSKECKKLKPIIVVTWLWCFAYMMIRMFSEQQCCED